VRPDQVDRLRALVARYLGLALDETKTSLLEDVLTRHGGERSADGFLAAMESSPAREMRALVPDLTVGETYFFRNPDQFHAFTDVVLPERTRARGAERTLRILSAGCASGEEAFSLSILVHEKITEPGWDASILAVDLNPVALERARRARFSAWALRETPQEIRQRWFRDEGREIVLAEAARSGVRFEERNLVDEDAQLWAPGSYDAVFCRNVLMYLTPDHARAIVERIGRALVPGGYLFLGHAETLRGLSGGFHLRHTHQTFYYQRRGDTESRENSAGDSALSPAPRSELGAPDAETWVERIQRASERIAEITAPRGPSAPPERPRPDLGPALDLVAQERYADALDGMRGLLGEGRDDPDALLLRAVLLIHGGRLQEAEEVCGRALELDELNAGAHYALALCREGSGDRRGALDHDQVAVYLDGSFAMPRLHLGLLARKHGDRDVARRELGQALVLLEREEPARVLLFGGGFRREALLALCRSELDACGGRS
ncbi:MAG TPA: CheR family methyltransferase, partial [Polyangiaceae bacterium]